MRSSDAHSAVPFTAVRRAYTDILSEGHRRHVIHGLFEVDVDDLRQSLRDRSDDGGEPISLTAYVAWCVARAVDENPVLHAYRTGRRLIIFDDVDIGLQVEHRRDDGTSFVQSRIVRAANRKTVSEISDETRSAQGFGESDRRRLRGLEALSSLPRFLRAPIWRLVMSRPVWGKRYGGTVVVSSVGMFTTRAGWGIPISPATLMVTVGGIGVRPVVIEGRPERREHLSLTVTLNHDIVDGGPAARFAERLAELIESGAGLGWAPDTGR